MSDSRCIFIELQPLAITHGDIVKIEGFPADATTEGVPDFALHTGQVVSLEAYGRQSI